jgi:hypothetical protein
MTAKIRGAYDDPSAPSLAVEDDQDDVEDVLALVAIPRDVVVVAPPFKLRRKTNAKVLGPLTFHFKMECSSGIKQQSIALDGFSHTSKRRRAYAECVHDDHDECHFYNMLHNFSEPWMAVATILYQIRAGALVKDKWEHKQLPLPTEAEVADLRAEMPKLLFEVPRDL